MSLIQVNVDDEIRRRADAAFARCGITTPMAMKMMVTQVANEDRTPFDGLFTAGIASELAEDVRRDMVYAEALELGLIAEGQKGDDPTRISASVLEELGVSPEEVGQ